MNKGQLVEYVATQTDISQASAKKAVDAVLKGITGALKNGDEVTIPNFGSFKTGERAARTGRNPQTGQEIQIAAARTVKFKAGAGLKSAVK